MTDTADAQPQQHTFPLAGGLHTSHMWAHGPQQSIAGGQGTPCRSHTGPLIAGQQQHACSSPVRTACLALSAARCTPCACHHRLPSVCTPWPCPGDTATAADMPGWEGTTKRQLLHSDALCRCKELLQTVGEPPCAVKALPETPPACGASTLHTHWSAVAAGGPVCWHSSRSRKNDRVVVCWLGLQRVNTQDDAPHHEMQRESQTHPSTAASTPHHFSPQASCMHGVCGKCMDLRQAHPCGHTLLSNAQP
jgi:hypothetical protein